MMPPPPSKRPSSVSAQASMSEARKVPSDVGKRQQAATGAPPPRPSAAMGPPPPRSRAPSRGEKLQATAAVSSQVGSLVRAIGAAISPEMSRDASPVRTFPDLMGDAQVADAALSNYKSPRTEPRVEPAEPAARRSSETLTGTTMTELARRLEASASKPVTREQERISKADQRAWATFGHNVALRCCTKIKYSPSL